VEQRQRLNSAAVIDPSGFVAKNPGDPKTAGSSGIYAAMPNSLPMNFTWATTFSFGTLLTLPFLVRSIASIPRSVRHAVGTEPDPLASQVRRCTFL
jgi:hypothetical protein